MRVGGVTNTGVGRGGAGTGVCGGGADPRSDYGGTGTITGCSETGLGAGGRRRARLGVRPLVDNMITMGKKCNGFV